MGIVMPAVYNRLLVETVSSISGVQARNSHRLYIHSGIYEQAAQHYAPLYPFLNDQIQFLFEYAQSLSKSEEPAQSNEILQRAVQISCDPMLYNIMGKNYQALKEYAQAENYLIKSTQMVPHRIYPWYLLMKLYDEMGLPEKACETASIVETKEPKVQSQAVREMREEARKICAK
jgi:tetratricopeptide (TPR) repeat protein